MPKKPKRDEYPGLPWVDMSRVPRQRKLAHVIDFTKKPVGYWVGDGMSVTACPACRKHGLERRDDVGRRKWEHVREFYLTATGGSASRVILQCSEKL